MTKIGLLSDTHRYLDPLLIPVLEDCDQIWHAGDIGSLEVLHQLNSLKKELKVVYGNIDGHEIRIGASLNLVWEVEKMKVLMTHIGGYPEHYPSKVKKLLLEEQPDLFVCGHSHILKVMYDQNLKFLLLNPGACGKEGFHQVRTMIRFSIESDKVKDLAVIELGKR